MDIDVDNLIYDAQFLKKDWAGSSVEIAVDDAVSNTSTFYRLAVSTSQPRGQLFLLLFEGPVRKFDHDKWNLIDENHPERFTRWINWMVDEGMIEGKVNERLLLFYSTDCLQDRFRVLLNGSNVPWTPTPMLLTLTV